LIDKAAPSTPPNNPSREGAKEISRAAFNAMPLLEQGAYIRGGGLVKD
jgi:hypothetical protein